MQTVKDNLHLLLFLIIAVISITFSTLNYSAEPDAPEESKEEHTAQTAQEYFPDVRDQVKAPSENKSMAPVLQEYFLDFWYWIEGISTAQFMLTKEEYGDEPLTRDDLRRVYDLSFCASRTIAYTLYSLRNAFYSAAYLNGTFYDPEALPRSHHGDHILYIDWLRDEMVRTSPQYVLAHDRINAKQLFDSALKTSYRENYKWYKRNLAGYFVDSKPYIAGLGDKRARQWLRYEMTDALYKQIDNSNRSSYVLWFMSNILESLEGIFYGTDYKAAHRPLSESFFTSLEGTLRLFTQRPLVRELLPELRKKILDFIERHDSTYDRFANTLANTKELRKLIAEERDRHRLPYYMTSISLAFSNVDKLKHTTLNLHTLSTLSLDELQILKKDLEKYRKKIMNRAVTPISAAREMGISLKEALFH